MMHKFFAFWLLAMFTVGCSTKTPVAESTSAEDRQNTGTVTIEIHSDSMNRTIEVPSVAQGTTLEEVMRSIDEVDVQLSGSGTTAFVNQIGDTATQSAEGWTFRVDGEWANEGIGTTKLAPPTTVAWQFGTMEEAFSSNKPDSTQTEPALKENAPAQNSVEK